jgi:hypothetical protein
MSTSCTIHTYAEYERWVDGFFNPDGPSLLFVVGNPGTGKSVSFKTKLDKERHHYINAARLTPFQLFKQLYRVRNKALVFDDVDEALRNATTSRLLMALCETDDNARTVSWLGTESQLQVRRGQRVVRVPQEFETTSRVCSICNDWAILTRKFGALLDRGTVVFFEPDAAEVHSFVGRWFRDEEIYDFIGEHVPQIGQHSIRDYVNAAALKRLGLDWQAVLIESWSADWAGEDVTEQLVRRLVADPVFATDKARIEAFKAHPDGGSRRNWFYLKKKLGLDAAPSA